MALVQCRECGLSISDQANQCPHCGITRPVKRTVHPLITLSFVLLAVGFMLSKGASTSETNAIANDTSGSQVENSSIGNEADGYGEDAAYGKAYQKKIPDPANLYSQYDQLPLDKDWEQEMSILRLWVLFRIGAVYGNCDLIDKNVGANLSKKYQEFRNNETYNSILSNRRLNKEKAEYAANMIVGYDPVYGYEHCAIAIISYLKAVTKFANSKSFPKDTGQYFSYDDISPVIGSSLSVDEWRNLPVMVGQSTPREGANNVSEAPSGL